jgi:hypothetical protein
MAATLATTTKEELAVPDKKNNFFREEGLYEVYASGAEVKTSKAGNPYTVVHIKAADGKEDDVMINVYDRDKNPNVFKMQFMLKAFGLDFSQAVIKTGFDAFVSALDELMVGKVYCKLSYYGYIVDYVEKGLYCLRDYGKGAKPYPDNKVVDPVNGDVFAFQSREEGETMLRSRGWKLGGKQWDFVRPADDFEMNETQIAAVEMVTAKLEDKLVEAPPEEKKPDKPKFLIKK